MKIRSGCVVKIELEVRDDEGEVVLTTDGEEPLEYVQAGEDLPLPGLERALEGAEPGAEVSVSLTAADAFGEYDVQSLVSVPRSALPPDAEVVPGDWLPVEVESDDGEPLGDVELRVESISEDAVVLDANHPLAGIDVTCRVRVVDVSAGEGGAED